MRDLARAANLLESGGWPTLAAAVRAAMDQIERSELDREERAALPPSQVGYLYRRLAELAERVAALESTPIPMEYGPFDADKLAGPVWDWHITDVANVRIGDYLLDVADEFRQVASKVSAGESVGFEYLSSTDGAGNDQYRLIWAGPTDSRVSVYTPVARK